MADFAYVLRAPYSVTDPSLSKVFRDPLMTGANDGVRSLWDTAFPWCYPGGAFNNRPAAGPPAADAVVRDISEHADCAVRKGAGAIGFAGGGFRLDTLTGRPGYVEVPAAANADIWGAAPAGAASVGASQRWLECMYLFMPDPRLWAGQAANAYAPIICTSGTDAKPNAYYDQTPEKAWFGLKTDGSVLASFQTALNTVVNLAGSVVPHIGKLTQIATWRTGSGTGQAGIMIRSSAGRAIVTGTVADNAASYAASTTKMGVTNQGQWPTSGLDMSQSPFRIYRGFLENLARSGRTPTTVLDDDWTRVQARIAASAAANGGVASIFS